MISQRKYYFYVLFFFFIVIFTLSKVNIINWDNLGYYIYLPSNLIWNDNTFNNYNFVDSLITKQYKLSGTLYQLVPLPDNKYLIKYTSGISILTFPFFLIAHFITVNFTSYPADGFSYFYQLGIYVATLIYTLIGIYFLLKALNKIFDFKTALITLIILTFTTNIIYMFMMSNIVHNYGFTFYSIFLWLVIKWHESRNIKNSILVGLTYGFILAIRPTDAIILLIFILWEVKSFKDLKNKFVWFIHNIKLSILIFIFSLLPILPQIFYWYKLTGEFIINSYINPGEGFDFSSPHLFNFLFSFRKGWVVYTPIILLLVPFYILLFQRKREYFYASLIFLIVSVYLHSSWTCWWYAASYSQRSMLQSYVVLSIPFAIFVKSIIEKRNTLNYILTFFIILFLILNLFKYYQFRVGILDPSRMTKEYYFTTFFNIRQPSDEIRKLLLVERPTTVNVEFNNKNDYILSKKIKILNEKLNQIPNDRLIMIDSLKNYFVIMDSNYIYTPAFKIKYSDITKLDHAYIILKSNYFNYYHSIDNPLSLVATFEHNGEYYEYKSFNTETNNTDDSCQYKSIEMIYLTPEVRSKNDELSIYFWLRGKNKVFVGPIDIEIWENKKSIEFQ